MAAPILSTPAEHIFENPTPAVIPDSRLSDEQLYVQYEIQRTVREIREGRWKRIALQFPDEMLVDAPRVFERLREGLKAARVGMKVQEKQLVEAVKSVQLDDGEEERQAHETQDFEERLTILADTSYGACCVDEIAAEHVDADVVVHYGRACLSPTARLPVIYVFTSKPLDIPTAVSAFRTTYPDKNEKVCLMADIPYHHHLHGLYEKLKDEGYENIFETDIIRDPSSVLPNRTIPPEVQEDKTKLKDHAIFHIADPPTSLLLILSSRVKTIHIFPTSTTTTPSTLSATTAPLLRRRYALLTTLSSTSTIGILINTLSVSNYLSALTHLQSLITAARKKYYVFVVGKVNAAKIANFAEIGGWVVVGCWESSLIESKEFLRPIVTPFELEVALVGDGERVWGGEWVGDFGEVLGRERRVMEEVVGGVGGKQQLDELKNVAAANDDGEAGGNWDDQPSDDEPPDFDLRTGRYVSHSRPMRRAGPSSSSTAALPSSEPSSALIQRPNGELANRNVGGLATVNGVVSPAAEFLRSKRTWQGLGSDYGEIAYERDEEGRIRGAVMEEGRGGVARGYQVGEGSVRT